MTQAGVLYSVGETFPKLEKYVEWDRQNGKPPTSGGWRSDIRYLLKWGDAGDAGKTTVPLLRAYFNADYDDWW